MALDDTDRRRFALAMILTLLALPALWWVNRDESSRPNAASVGVDVGSGSSATTPPVEETVTVESTIGRSNLPPVETVRNDPPIFLDGPASPVGGISEIAVPSDDGLDSILTKATYGDLSGDESCLARGIATGELLTVTNLDNNRSITCRVTSAPSNPQDDLVLPTERFTKLADLTDAPIPVQIRR